MVWPSQQVSPLLLCAQRFHRSQFEPKKLFCLETEIRSWFQYRNVFDESRPSHPGPGRSSYFRESTLSVGILVDFEVTCTLDMNYSFRRSFFFIKCNEEFSFFQQFSNRRRSTGLDNLWSSAQSLAAGFPCGSALV